MVVDRPLPFFDLSWLAVPKSPTQAILKALDLSELICKVIDSPRLLKQAIKKANPKLMG